MIVDDYKGRGRRASKRVDNREGSWLFHLFMAWFRGKTMKT